MIDTIRPDRLMGGYSPQIFHMSLRHLMRVIIAFDLVGEAALQTVCISNRDSS